MDDLLVCSKGRNDWEFYEEAWNRTLLRGPSYWTEKKGHRFVESDSQSRTQFDVASETHLSNRQAELMEEDEAFHFPASNDEMEEIHESIDEQEDMDEMGWSQRATARHPSNADTLTRELHAGTCETITTVDQLDRYQRLLNDFQNMLLDENAPSETTLNPGGMLSMPEVEHREEDPRRQKLMSPPKKGIQRSRRRR